MQPRTPTHRQRWSALGPCRTVKGSRQYRRKHLHVISSFDHGEWHVSVSSRRGKVTPRDLDYVRQQFQMEDAESGGPVIKGCGVMHLWKPAPPELLN